MRGTKAKQSGQGFRVGDTTYQPVRVKPERFFGTEKVWIGEARVTITDPERTLLDGLTMPQYCRDFAEVLHAFEVRGADLNLDPTGPRKGPTNARWMIQENLPGKVRP